MTQDTTPDPTCTVLPDGSAFAVASWPLPKDHWLYAPRGEWDSARDEYAECPPPILTRAQAQAVTAAARYAIRGATMCGQEQDFDPDALVLNLCYALCGPAGGAALAQPQQAVSSPSAELEALRDMLKAEVDRLIAGKAAPQQAAPDAPIAQAEAVQPPMPLPVAVNHALLNTAGTERLREWALIGPVQRAALETFAEALLNAGHERAERLRAAVDEAALWTELRDAAGIAPGSSPRPQAEAVQPAQAVRNFDLATMQRASEMLTAYAELILRDGATHVDEHHYVPDVRWVAEELRGWAANNLRGE
jgi:hypothetical protein